MVRKLVEQGRHRSLWAVLAWLVLGGADFAGASVPSAEQLWVEVRNERGQVVTEVAPSDLQILEAGEVLDATALEASGLEPGGLAQGDSRVVVYFDSLLSLGGVQLRGGEALAGLASELTRLGEVEVVTADPEPEVGQVTADALLLAERLGWAALRREDQGEILEVRRRALRELSSPALAALPDSERIALVVGAIEEESELVRERLHSLLAWASETPLTSRRGVLVPVLSGFDLDPTLSYAPHLEEEVLRAVVRQTSTLSLESEVERVARALAAVGWTVMPLSIPPSEVDLDAPKVTQIEMEDLQGNTTVTPGITIKPGRLFKRKKEEAEEETKVPEPELIAAEAPLRILARESGGDLVLSAGGLQDALERLAGRVGVRYASALPVDGGLAQLEVRPTREGWSILTRRWVSRAEPQAVTEARLRRLLAGREIPQGLDVAAVLKMGPTQGAPADLDVRLAVREIDPLPGETDLRVTTAIALPGGELRLDREVVQGENLADFEEWTYQTSLDLPEGASQVAVLVEELGRNLLGGSVAAVVQEGAEAYLPTPSVLEIQRPDRELLRGRVRFEARAFNSSVQRVVFMLDEREVAEKTGAPFTARINLGRTPRRQTLTVVAYDAAGGELGRDSALLNAGSGGLAVELVSPTNLRQTGPVDVEADITVPIERRLDRVLFFWNNEAVATLYSPPFRQRVVVPPDVPVGYLRVVAMLDDGTLAEDVLFMNGPDQGERLDVNLVELYVVVTDKNGRPVQGLRQKDFQVREEGQLQEVASFSNASDLPLTLGMAIDSSASMFVKMPRVQQAAIRFLESTFGDQDRAFLVDFDSQPRLTRGTTSELGRVVNSIQNLEAGGRTALWESIVFSLVQLQDVRGRKALVVFSDGADEDDQFPFSSCLSFARKMGVPIYLILTRERPDESTGLSLLNRSFTSKVNRLVDATGGRVFYGRQYRNLDEVYEEIEKELRSQYLLTYYPKKAGQAGVWRDVDVSVRQRGLTPRTLSGYWP